MTRNTETAFRLTPREAIAHALQLGGKNSPQIAIEMNITIGSARAYLSQVAAKLKCPPIAKRASGVTNLRHAHGRSHTLNP